MRMGVAQTVANNIPCGSFALFLPFARTGECVTVALYRYATTGQAPSGYDAATLGAALGRR